jgi:hypothetical protein
MSTALDVDASMGGLMNRRIEHVPMQVFSSRRWLSFSTSGA